MTGFASYAEQMKRNDSGIASFAHPPSALTAGGDV
jgi:hypothetical protein